jgi:uncharacterized protein (DUF1015 family)
MATIRPFTAVHYADRPDLEISRVVAPPYDVLDEKQKAELQARHPNNIVTIDLPFTPPKSVGPDAVYEQANITLRAWLSAGVLVQDRRAAMYPYTQSYEHNGKTYHRRGFICLVKLEPFGSGHIVPHEKTYPGPIEDRLKLMRATGMQLSPIFGLFSDPRNEINKLLYQNAGRPDLAGELEGVKNQLWSVIDAQVEGQVIDLMKARHIYIADGHHRYTTALHYQRLMEQENSGPLPAVHPANWVMFVLVPMQDDGLLILPTHRLIGGLRFFHIETLKHALGKHFDVKELKDGVNHLQDFINHELPMAPAHTFGLFDGATRKLYQLTLKDPSILNSFEPERSGAWRELDVAILQHYLIEKIIQPRFADGKEPTRGYTANPWEIAPQVDGKRYQIALLLKPTPLTALEQLAKTGEVMPQKSTYFYPKLATGMVLNPLR